MPRFDRTGPEGKGPRTGRGLGDCQSDLQTKNQPQGGNRPRRGRGFGRGNRQNQSNN